MVVSRTIHSYSCCTWRLADQECGNTCAVRVRCRLHRTQRIDKGPQQQPPLATDKPTCQLHTPQQTRSRRTTNSKSKPSSKQTRLGRVECSRAQFTVTSGHGNEYATAVGEGRRGRGDRLFIPS